MEKKSNNKSGNQTFSGYKRAKKTTLRIKLGDILSKAIISVGGIGTIVAVLTVCLFLLWVVLPLFSGAELTPANKYVLPDYNKKTLRIAVDDYSSMAWILYEDGFLRVFRIDNGKVLSEQRLFEDKNIGAVSFAVDNSNAAFGFMEGSFSVGTMGFKTDFFDYDQIPDTYHVMKTGERLEYLEGMLERISENQYRLQRFYTEFEDPVEIENPSPIVLIDHIATDSVSNVVLLTEDERLLYERLTRRKNLLTGTTTYQKQESSLPYSKEKTTPLFLSVDKLGTSVVLAWQDGSLIRYDTRKITEPFIIEKINVLKKRDRRLTAFTYLVGKSTLLFGDSSGDVNAWFPARMSDKQETQSKLVDAHNFSDLENSIISIASSSRMRMIATGCIDGRIKLYYVTSRKRLAATELGFKNPVLQIAFYPRDNGIIAQTPQGIYNWELDPGHPEATFSSLFKRVWYENSGKPSHSWQSSAATDYFEPKLGLIPLIFGTIKATLFSMLFGVPIALLAAIYTSEFLNPKTKKTIKPAVEMMASLPSVVLGFLAALVFAPIVEKIVPAILVMFCCVPVSFLAGAYIWQFLPKRIRLKFADWRFVFTCCCMFSGIYASLFLGPIAEKIFFAGNIMMWLDGATGSAFGGWFFILIPVSACITALFFSRFCDSWLREKSSRWSWNRCAAADVIKFASGALITITMSAGAAFALTLIGFDPRGVLVGTYDQRNALVVGFVMGFAVIPIIYTIADDALSSVPEHLRSGSLAAGATPWQTATRIIVPTAMSGIFSAIMIGLGRAVGETMIVLMAAGNTPVLDWNIFNGFRTLSANIAVELPEAVRNSTHYRTLFLAALTLFVMTFIVNTVAEIVRLRFRKKAIEL